MGTFLGNGYGLWKPTFTLDGTTKIFQTTMMFKNDTNQTPAAAELLFRNHWCQVGAPFHTAQMYIGFTLARTETYTMSGGVLSYNLNETPVVGAKAGALGTPINTSVLWNKRTGIVGKHYRGRNMLPNMWIDEGTIAQTGVIDAAQVTSLQTKVTLAYAADQGGACPQVLGHSTSEIIPTPLTALQVGAKVGSMPHRIRGF